MANEARYSGFLANEARYSGFLANEARYSGFLANEARYSGFLANEARYSGEFRNVGFIRSDGRKSSGESLKNEKEGVSNGDERIEKSRFKSDYIAF